MSWSIGNSPNFALKNRLVICNRHRGPGHVAAVPHTAQHPQEFQCQSDRLFRGRRPLREPQLALQRRRQRGNGPGHGIRGGHLGAPHAG